MNTPPPSRSYVYTCPSAPPTARKRPQGDHEMGLPAGCPPSRAASAAMGWRFSRVYSRLGANESTMSTPRSAVASAMKRSSGLNSTAVHATRRG